MIDLKTYNAMQRIVSRMEKERDETAGALKQVVSELKSEFGCSSIEEAEKLLLKLRKEYKKSVQKFRKKLRKFFEENPEEIEKLNSRDIEVLRKVAYGKEATKKGKAKRKGAKKKN